MKIDSTNRHINLKSAYAFYKNGGEENYQKAGFKSNEEADKFQQQIAKDEAALKAQKAAKKAVDNHIDSEKKIASASKNVDSKVVDKKDKLSEAIDALTDEASFLNFRYQPIVEDLLSKNYNLSINNKVSSLSKDFSLSLEEAYIISKVVSKPLTGRIGTITDFNVEDPIEERISSDRNEYRIIMDRDGMLKKVKQLSTLKNVVETAKNDAEKSIKEGKKEGLLESLEILLIASEL